MDVAGRQGIKIDVDKLSEELGSPVVPTISIKNIGLRELMEVAIESSKKQVEPGPKLEDQERWDKIREIANKVQSQVDKEITFIQKLENWTVQPWPGIPIALLVLIASLGVVVGGGKALRAVILLPLVRQVIMPFLSKLISFIVPAGVFRNVLVGEFGILVIGIEWPLLLYCLMFFILCCIFILRRQWLPT